MENTKLGGSLLWGAGLQAMANLSSLHLHTGFPRLGGLWPPQARAQTLISPFPPRTAFRGTGCSHKKSEEEGVTAGLLTARALVSTLPPSSSSLPGPGLGSLPGSLCPQGLCPPSAPCPEFASANSMFSSGSHTSPLLRGPPRFPHLSCGALPDVTRPSH